jgi:homeobox protein aristaless-related
MGGFYSPSASFQSLLANLSAAQRTTESLKPLQDEGLTTTSSSSARTSPSITAPVTPQSPEEDLKNSSIAALRLRAREHEIKLEMLRQTGHNISDIIS